MRTGLTMTCAVAVLLAAPAFAACPSAEAVAANAARYLGQEPAKSFGPGMSIEDGLCAQRMMVSELERALGRPVGYKVGLTNKAVQERFKIDHPVRGVLLERMLLGDGATVPAAAKVAAEADLLVTVKDEGINTARTRTEILRHLASVAPFIELPASPVLAQGELLDGPNLTAIDVAARLGVAGEPIPVEPTEAFAEALGSMTVTLVDETGKEHARAPGSALLGHPLEVVAWLVEDLARTGGGLKAGEVISLGSYSPFVPPAPGRKLTARYEGLPSGPAMVSVRFE